MKKKGNGEKGDGQGLGFQRHPRHNRDKLAKIEMMMTLKRNMVKTSLLLLKKKMVVMKKKKKDREVDARFHP
jgi:hypothetical protein